MPGENQNILKWGDIIRIHGVNLTKQRQEQSKGLIMSKGFTDSNIYYQKYSKFEKVNFYRESLFQIIPPSNFDIHDQLINNPTMLSANREALKIKALAEIQSLELHLNNKKGTNIPYGAEAVFRHVESHSYLRGLQKAADTGDGAFTIQVSPQPCSQIIWKINSHRSYQRDGDDIYFDDQLLIYHVFTDCYMNFAENDKSIYLDSIDDLNPIPEDEQIWNYIKNRPTIKRPEEKRISIINQNKSKCLWKFINHCTHQQFENQQKIKSHDIVYFQHTKNKGCISSSLNGDSYFIKETIDKKQSFQCFWELIPNQVNQLGPQKCNDFSARNIVTGKYLTFNDFKIMILPKIELQGGGFENEGLINLICDESQKKLDRGPLIPKDPNTKPIIKFSQNLFQRYELINVAQLTQDSFQIVKVQVQTMRNIQFVISSHEHLIKFLDRFSSYMAKENAEPKFKPLSEKDKRQDKKQTQMYDFIRMNVEQLENIRYVLELLAGKIYGTSYSQIVSSGNTPNPLMQKILVQTGTTELIIEIIHHLFVPFVFIQENTQASADRAQRVRIEQIFQRAYKLLEKIVINNEKNKFYLSRWVDLFLKHSKNINREYIQECLVGILQNNPKAIEATITSKEIDDLIKCFYAQASRTRNGDLTTKYLRLFSTFINCQTRVIKQNQDLILEKFFKDMQNVYCYRFKIEAKEDQVESPQDPFSKIRAKRVQIALDKQDFSPITKYYKDWGPKWNYFLHFVNLLADVCMDKNNYAIENVSALVSLQTVTVILFDPEITKLNQQIKQANETQFKKTGIKRNPILNVRQPFVRIAHYVYIYNSKFTTIKTIKNISRWYRHQGEEKGVIRKEDINTTKRPFEGQKEEEEKFYLNCILKFIEGFVEECNQENANLNILYTVLRLFKETILLGLWQSITQFRKLIPLLIMRVTKIQNSKIFDLEGDSKKSKTATEIVMLNKQGLSFNRPEISLNINCKIKATQIFKFINELEIDIRLRYMMNFFKGLYEATQSFEDYNKQQVQGEIKDEQLKARNARAKQQFQKSEYATILGEVKKISEDQDIMLKENIWCNKFKELTPFEYNGPIDDMSKDRYLFQGGQLINTSFDSMVLSLLQLPVYKNDKLLSSSLKMLRSIFEQRKDLIDQFKGILVCGKGNLLEVYMTLKYMRQKFDMLTNVNILKLQKPRDEHFSYFIEKSYDSMEKINARRSGILQDLFFLSRTLKQDINLKNIESLMFVQEQIFNKSTVFNYLHQKERNNKLFQAVNIAEGIYIPLITYIKLIGDSNFAQIHRKILFAIYQYLALICFNNLQSKQKLMQYVPFILPHLKRRVGAANFLYQVCLNNKMLISNTALVRQIIDGALEACIELDREEMANAIMVRDERENLYHYSYEKSQILFALRGILLLNDEGFRINQQMIMNRFQDNKFKKLIFKGKVDFTSRRDNFSLNYQQSYVASFFQLFSVVVQSKNFINVGKLENIHPYTYCLDCLKSTNRWQIRRALRAYINRLYYVNKDRDIFLFQEFIRKQFKIINDQLEDLINLHRNKLINDQIMIPNGIRFKFAQSQIFQMILQIFITIHQMLLKPEFYKILKRQIEKQFKKNENQRQIHDQFHKLLHHIGCLNILYPTKSIISAFIRQLYSHIERVMMLFSERYLQKLTRQEGEQVIEEADDLGIQVEKKNYIYDHSKSFFRNLACMIRDIKDKEKKEQLKKKLAQREKKQGTPQELKKLYIDLIFQCQGENLKPIIAKKYREVSPSLYKPHIQTANSRIFKVIAKPTLTENQENIELNRRLSIVKEIIDDSPVFRKLRQDQFLKLVTSLTRIDATSKAYYEQEWLNVDIKKSIAVVSLKQIFTKSFSLIMSNHQTIQDDQKMFIIKIARCYITEAVEGKQTYKLPVDKWDPEYYSGQEKLPPGETESELIKRQNLIQQCGGSQFIQSIFKYYANNLDSKRELLNEILLLGIAYLFNGNPNCQNSLLRVLTNDPDNFMLLSVQRLIHSIGTLLIEIRKTKQVGKLRRFAYSIVDTYDFFDVKNNIILKEFGNSGFDKFEARNEKACELALCRMFRFLQLFCQNGNTSMKKFLLHQTNDAEGKVKKTNSINFIETTTLLLRKLFKIMNDKVVNIPSTLLDFINQITQLPCIDNQIAFMNSTFFQDLSYLADFFMNQENLSNRKFTFVAESEDQPVCELRNIYQKGIDLALCNFEGNDNILIWEFLSKCQPKFLWVVIKQNLLKILQDKIEYFNLQRYEDEAETDFQKRLIKKFTKKQINDYISQEQNKTNMLNQEIQNILSVLYILKKIEVFSNNCLQKAYADKDKPNQVQKAKHFKAKKFKQELIYFASEIQGYDSVNQFFEVFNGLILSIQISSFNGNEKGLQNIYFPNHPIFKYLASDTRDSIMMRVKRQTQRDKQISLLQLREQVYEQIELNYKLKHQQFTIPYFKQPYKFQITAEYAQVIRKKARYISFFICFLLTLYIVVDHDKQELTSTFTYTSAFSELLMRSAAAAQMVYTLIYVTIWIMLRQPLAMKKYDNEGGEEESKKNTQGRQTKKKLYKQTQGWDLLVGHYKSILNSLSPYSKKIKDFIMSNWLVRNIILSFYALSQYQSGFLSILMFVTATFLGNFVGVEWYTIHLFDIFTSYSQLTNIFKAILNNFKKLALLSFLAGVFILVFNVVSLNTYTPVIWQQDLPQQACEDIIGCVLQLYTSGAVGEDMQEFVPDRFIFDIVFTVFMEIMFQNIVSGIMIDSFSELKQEDAARSEDKKTLCYICGMDKPSMERQGSTFDKHVTTRHFLWNYLYYLYCLRLKSPTDFTGLEYEIDLKVKEEDVEWFPALGEADSGGQTEKVISELEQNVKKVFEHLDKAISDSKGVFKDAITIVEDLKAQREQPQQNRQEGENAEQH